MGSTRPYPTIGTKSGRRQHTPSPHVGSLRSSIFHSTRLPFPSGAPSRPGLPWQHEHQRTMPSIWATRAIQDFQARHNMTTTTFSQCQLGMNTSKPTTLMIKNMPRLKRLNGWMCTHRHWRDPNLRTSDLSRRAWGLNKAIAQSLVKAMPWLQEFLKTGKPPDRPTDTVRL